jgi:hypothetical protein
MTPDEIVQAQIEAWKITIQVQQHFNDIEWKIRGLALTVLTAVLTAAAAAVHYKVDVHIWGYDIHLAAVLLAIACFAWLLFYSVDQHWYHHLLKGSVRQGITLEKILKVTVPGIELTTTIGDASPSRMKWYPKRYKAVSGSFPRLRWKLEQAHSTEKLKIFYFLVAAILILLAYVVQVGS